MSDLISRQAVLKLLHTLPPEEAMTKAMLIQSVKQMDAAQPKDQGREVRHSTESQKQWQNNGGEQDDESRSNSNAQTDTRARGMGTTDKSSGI